MYVLNVNDLVCFCIFHQMMVILFAVLFSRIFILRTTLEIGVPRCALIYYP